jgi:hypothetical protein
VGALLIVFMAFDTAIHLARPAPVVEAFAKLGLPLALAAPIGLIELACTLAYAVPRTRALGAVLLTGILGGAVTAHARVGDPLFPTVIFPAIVGVMVWLPLYLTDSRLRTLLASPSAPPAERSAASLQ